MAFSSGVFSGSAFNELGEVRVYSPRRGSIPWLDSLTEWPTGSYFWVSGFSTTTGECWDYKVHWDQLPYAKPQDVLDYLAFSAYAGVRYTAAKALSDLDDGWQRLTGLDEQIPSTPRHVTVDLVNGKFSFTYPGIYSLSLTGFLSHAALAAKQNTNFRVYNVTDTESLTSRPVFSANGSVSTAIHKQLLLEISVEEVGDEFAIEIGGGDDYSSVVLDTFEMVVFSVSEFQGTLPS